MSQNANVKTGNSNSGKGSRGSGTIQHGNVGKKNSSFNESAVHKPVPGNGGKK